MLCNDWYVNRYRRRAALTNAFRITAEGISPIIDPTTGSGDVFLLPEMMGQSGRPFAFMVKDPPHKTRPRHYHHGDVLYVYTKGEHHIEGEGTYRAGDVRWTKAGHIYGPETTGPEGGAWWVISYNDPVPVDMLEGADEPKLAVASAPANELPKFSRPYDWGQIEIVVRTGGGAILEGFLSSEEAEAANTGIDQYLTAHTDEGKPASGSASYDMFLGHRTVRLHGLAEKIPALRTVLANEVLLEGAERLLKPKANSILLNAGELIQIGPGEPPQFLHRDSDSWPHLPIEQDPIIVNFIVALDPFTRENGATYVATSSWEWDRHRQPKENEFARAEMGVGDAILFRGDLLHGGGENNSNTSRRGLSLSFCAGWLRPVENSFLNVPLETVKSLPPKLQAVLGYAAHNAAACSVCMKMATRGGL
jgi:hypothetical protein